MSFKLEPLFSCNARTSVSCNQNATIRSSNAARRCSVPADVRPPVGHRQPLAGDHVDDGAQRQLTHPQLHHRVQQRARWVRVGAENADCQVDLSSWELSRTSPPLPACTIQADLKNSIQDTPRTPPSVELVPPCAFIRPLHERPGLVTRPPSPSSVRSIQPSPPSVRPFPRPFVPLQLGRPAGGGAQ